MDVSRMIAFRLGDGYNLQPALGNGNGNGLGWVADPASGIREGGRWILHLGSGWAGVQVVNCNSQKCSSSVI